MKQTILLDTRADYSMEDYKDYCELNDIEFDENNIDGFYAFQSKMQEWDVEDFWENLKYSKHKEDKVVITGVLGLWDGHHEIYPQLTNLEDAISKCIGTCPDAKVYVDEDGALRVNGYHHDGTNCFTILFLTEYGEENFYEDDWNEMSNEEKEKCFDYGNFDYLF